MKHIKEFPFHRARRITPGEVEMYRKAIEEKLGVRRPPRGRPLKKVSERSCAVSIRLDPRILKWARAEAKRRGLGYQTVINQALLKLVA
jgi:uncharacterized protein (DUF4415 family)